MKTCKHCGGPLQIIHEETGQYGVWEYSEQKKVYEHFSDELPDYTTFHCGNCHAELYDIDITDNVLTVKDEEV